MASKIWKWVNDRMPIATILQLGLDEEIPGGASFFFTLGSATLFIFILQIVTGVWQLFYYVPTIDHAYDSLTFLRLLVPYGWLIHGLHYWGASAMVVLIGLHMLRTFIWGAYKKPREMTWLIGIALLLLTIGMSFTGAALPWDERGYWAAEVGTSIAGTVPFIGSWLKFLLVGGKVMGQLTLSRFFILHTAILPGIAMITIAAHMIAFRKFGSVGPWSQVKRNIKGDFWPDQVVKDVIIVLIIFLILVALSAFAPPPFTGPADPLDTTFTPKPEWNFLFLYQALKFFPGVLEVIGTVGIPTLVILLFVSLPFFDRNPEHNPAKRPAMMLGGLVFVVLLLTLTISGYNSKSNIEQPKVKPASKISAVLSPSAEKGKIIFGTYGCIACHTMSGSGGKIGPDLTNESQKGHSKDWILVQLKDSKKHNPKSIMPSFSMLNDSQLNQLADFLLSAHPAGSAASAGSTQMSPAINNSSTGNDTGNTGAVSQKHNDTPGPAADMIGNVAHGALLFRQDCESCHGINGKGGIANPGADSSTVPQLNPITKTLYNNDPQTFADNIDTFIQHGSNPAGANPTLRMFDYGDSYTLTQQQIANIEAYILSINGVNRAQLKVTSFSPRHYFFIIASALIVLTLGLLILNYKMNKQ